MLQRVPEIRQAHTYRPGCFSKSGLFSLFKKSYRAGPVLSILLMSQPNE
jgi:hypothetical protein